jgi:hypothetical protein
MYVAWCTGYHARLVIVWSQVRFLPCAAPLRCGLRLRSVHIYIYMYSLYGHIRSIHIHICMVYMVIYGLYIYIYARSIRSYTVCTYVYMYICIWALAVTWVSNSLVCNNFSIESLIYIYILPYIYALYIWSVINLLGDPDFVRQYSILCGYSPLSTILTLQHKAGCCHSVCSLCYICTCMYVY